MLSIGLTGGIGSGKSTVARFFSELGVPVLSADSLAREVIAPGTQGHREIVEHWGDSLFNRSGALDRARVRAAFFKQPQQLQQLEAIIHPKVEAAIKAELKHLLHLGHAYAVVEIPLLIEARLQHLVERILVVDTALERQIERAMQRDGATLDNIESIIQRQVDRQTRLSHAHHVVRNETDIESLQQQVLLLHTEFLDSHTRRR